MIRVIALVCLVVAAVSVAGVPVRVGAAEPGGTLRVALTSDVVKLDPHRANDCFSTYVFDEIFDTLVALDDHLNFVPHVAESWQAAPDGTVWTFKIRKGITFSDGSPLTAKDVAFSFHRILDVPEAVSGKLSKVNMIAAVDVVDDSTVRFRLKRPYAPFLGAARQHITPQAVVERMGDEAFNRAPVGSGPFRLRAWRKGEQVTLVRNDRSWLKKPNLDSVVFRPIEDGTSRTLALLAGEVDMVDSLLPQMIDRVRGGGFTVIIKPSLFYQYLGFRQYASPYTNVKFRVMVQQAIDVDRLVATVYGRGGTRAYSPVEPGLWPRNEAAWKTATPKYDPARARALFEELIKDGVMTKDTPIVVHVSQNTDTQKIGEIAVTSLKQIGVNATLKVSEWTAFLDNVINSKDGEIYTLGTSPAQPDPDAVYAWLFATASNNGGNILGLKAVDNKAVDDLIARAAATTDRRLREQLYTRINQTVIFDQRYHVPLVYPNQIVGLSAKVHDPVPMPICGSWMVTGQHNTWMSR